MQKPESMLEDSCVLTDPLKSASRSKAVCETCRLGEDLLLNKGPLIPMAFEQRYFLCRSCIKSYVANNVKVEQRGYWLKYSADNLFVPGTKSEFPRNYVIDGKTIDLINIPKINTTIYIVLERTDYDRPLGHVEGIVLKMNEATELTLGSGPRASVKLQHRGVQPLQCSISFEGNQYYIHESTLQPSTFIRPYNNPILNQKDPSVNLRMHDLFLTISYRNQVPPTSNEFILNDTGFQMPVYSKRENFIPDSLADISNSSTLNANPREGYTDHLGQVKAIPQFQTKLGKIIQETALSMTHESE